MNTNKAHQFPLFTNLPDRALQALDRFSRKCHFQAGEVLFTEGTSSEYVYLQLEGDVEIIKSLGTPDERCVAVSHQGSILGEMSLFSQEGTHTASARADSPVRLLMIPTAQFDELLHVFPELSFNLLKLFTHRLQKSENLTIQDLRLKNRQLTQAYHDLQVAQAAIIEKEKLEHELGIAGAMQRNILPETLPSLPGLDFGALMVPAKLVGGDFYDFIPLDDRQLAIVVGDVCDKGMPAALFMALAYSSIRAEALRHNDPGSTLRAVNEHLLQINRSEMFVTLLYGILDILSLDFSYARAGHTTPLLLDNHNLEISLPFALGQPLGIFEKLVIDEGNFSIPPGGTLLIYSDGLSETIDDIHGSPKIPELCLTLLKKNNLSAQALCDRLWRHVGGDFDESIIKDDFTVVAVKSQK